MASTFDDWIYFYFYWNIYRRNRNQHRRQPMCMKMLRCDQYVSMVEIPFVWIWNRFICARMNESVSVILCFAHKISMHKHILCNMYKYTFSPFLFLSVCFLSFFGSAKKWIYLLAPSSFHQQHQFRYIMRRCTLHSKLDTNIYSRETWSFFRWLWKNHSLLSHSGCHFAAQYMQGVSCVRPVLRLYRSILPSGKTKYIRIVCVYNSTFDWDYGDDNKKKDTKLTHTRRSVREWWTNKKKLFGHCIKCGVSR